jgi:hypothetical protein
VAIVRNDPFPGTDYNSYQSWQQVKAPDGRVFYVIPGYPGYVYDPVASNASGRRVFRVNPSQQLADQQQERDAVDAQRRQQEEANSVGRQILPVVAGTGAVLASNEIMRGGFGAKPAEVVRVLDNGTRAMNDGSYILPSGEVVPATAPVPAAGTGTASAGVPVTQSQAAAQGATAPVATGTDASGAVVHPGLQQPGAPQGAVVGDSTTVRMADGTTADVNTGQVADANGNQITGADAARVLQGAMAIYQGYRAYRQWQDGDRVGAAISGTSAGLTGAGALGYATAGGAGAVLGFYGPSAYKYGRAVLEGEAKEDDYLKAGLLAGGPLTAWATPVMDMAGIKWKAGKHKDQLMRDQVRGFMQEKGMIDQNYQLDLGNGKTFDIGKDGGSRPYNVDFSQKGIGEVVGLANPLAAIMSAGNQKLTSDFAGYFTNAITQSGDDARSVMQNLYKKAGVDQARAFSILDELEKSGKLDKATADAYRNGVNQAFGKPFAGTASKPQSDAKPTTTTTNKPSTSAPTSTVTPSQSGAPLVRGPGPAPATGQPVGKGAGLLPSSSVTTLPGNIADPRLIGKPLILSPEQATAAGIQFVPTTPAQAAAQGAIVQPPRSSTLSPGIGLDRLRIRY